MTILIQFVALAWQLYLEYHLKPTWDWLISVMDSTEAQLRFGSVLSNITDPSSPTHPLHSAYLRNLRERSHREEPPARTAAMPPTLETRRRSRFGLPSANGAYPQLIARKLKGTGVYICKSGLAAMI